MDSRKLAIVMVGHVDHGKSTLIGRLLYDTNSVSSDKIAELEKASKATDNKLEFAFLLDHLREEREQGITIDTTQTFFRSQKREYQIIDAPGHVEFVKNMVTGAAQATSAVLIVDAKEGVMQQTKRHSYILSLLGMKNVIVVVNKMDKVNYSEERYNEILKDIKEVFRKLHLQSIQYIPVSALDGDNVCNPSQNISWYKGKTLLGMMDELELEQEQTECLVIFPVQDVYKRGDKRISVGRLEAGILHVNDEIMVVQSGQVTTVKSIEKFLEEPVSAKAGECIGITTEAPLFLERGNVICDKKANICYKSEIEASIFWMGQEPVRLGEKLIIRCDTQETTCEVEEIYSKVNTGQLVEEEIDAKEMGNLDAGKIRIVTKKPLAFSKFSEYKSIGRFVLLKENNICAGGIIL
ncbi:MAG: GTP-binding protein [Lachnospiraceae bacterium]|nr:GTP-binding protein [Lachnospiraceae bacterium]